MNHEYTELHMMFPGLDPKTMVEQATKEMVDIELAAHGGSIVELRKTGGRWQVVAGQPLRAPHHGAQHRDDDRRPRRRP